jgi:hypothetical protein
MLFSYRGCENALPSPHRIVPQLRKRMLILFSLLRISRQAASTFRIRLTSAWMKMNSPSGFNWRHSAVMRAAASCERPMKYARGDRADRANSFRAASPMPFVAPTKTATRPGSVVAIWEFEDWTSGRETILDVGDWSVCRQLWRLFEVIILCIYIAGISLVLCYVLFGPSIGRLGHKTDEAETDE